MRRAAFALAATLVVAASLAMSGPARPTEAPQATSNEPSNVLVLTSERDTLEHIVQQMRRLDIADLGQDGGVALLEHTDALKGVLAGAAADPGLHVVIRSDSNLVDPSSVLAFAEDLGGAGQVWMVSSGSGRAGDDVGAVWLGAGPLDGQSSIRALTSDSTRRNGVVIAEDILPTMRVLAGLSPGGGPGSVMHPVDAPPPLALHAKHLANRRMTVPVQTAAAVYVTLAALFCVGLLALRRRLPRWLLSFGAFLALSVAPLAVTLLLAGHLPTLTYGTVVPFVIGVTIVGTLACFAVRPRFGALAVPAAVGAAALVALVGEAAVSWTAALTPFLGGSELDGGRFYGMPNVFIGLLLGSSLYVAQRLKVLPGLVLLCAGGLLAGLPGIGANLGGALTLFAAAGLWLGVRRWGRFGLKPFAAGAGVLLAGMAVVLAAHRYLTSAPTHVTRFEETSGRSLPGIWHTVLDRLGVGIDLIGRNPAALAPTLGTLVLLAVVLRPPAPIREAFERHREWRDAMVVILLASVVAYLGNDSGPAAAGLGFGMALGGTLYVALAEEPGKIGGL